MKEVYGFAQVRASAPTDPGAEAPPPPEDFKEYKQNEGGNGVIGMIQSVIDESKETETDAIRSEGDANAAYEEFMKNANKSLKALIKSVADKKEKAAQADANLIRAKAEQIPQGVDQVRRRQEGESSAGRCKPHSRQGGTSPDDEGPRVVERVQGPVAQVLRFLAQELRRDPGKARRGDRSPSPGDVHPLGRVSSELSGRTRQLVICAARRQSFFE